MEKAQLQGKVILVTGATGTIGQALCPALVEQGATVVLMGRNIRKLERLYDALDAAESGSVAIVPLDLAGASPADYDRVTDGIQAELGRIDGLIHLACAFSALSPLEQTKAEAYMQNMQVNLHAAWLLTQSALPFIKKAKGCILFTDDDVARSHEPFWGGYGISKAGVRALTDMLAAELKGSQVHVDCVTPPPIQGGLRNRAFTADVARQAKSAQSVTTLYLDALQQGFATHDAS